jgi:peptidoglycan LD-endopeptidase LytH
MRSRFNRRRLILLFLGLVIVLAATGCWLLRGILYSPTRDALLTWFNDRSARPALITSATTPCPGAPFRLPSIGFVGLLYGDGLPPYSLLNPHPGIDIFGNGEPGTVPVYAAFDGYLTRLADWKSAVIIRVPKDPLNPSRQIWLYYTHMASRSGDQSYIIADFPPGTSEKFVKQGDLLGFQGMYNGGIEARPIGLHLHFSIVLSEDGGAFRNEARFNNTVDPSPYFGLTLHAANHPTIPVRCGP